MLRQAAILKLLLELIVIYVILVSASHEDHQVIVTILNMLVCCT
jgi:hypothetical protein